jgi:hypothetical protein
VHRAVVGLIAVAAIAGIAAAATAPTPGPPSISKAMWVQPIPVSPGDTLTFAFFASNSKIYKTLPGMKIAIVDTGDGYGIWWMYHRDSATKKLVAIFGDSVYTHSVRNTFTLADAKNLCESTLVMIHFRGDTARSSSVAGCDSVWPPASKPPR